MRSPVDFPARAEAQALKAAVLALGVFLAAGGTGRGQTAADPPPPPSAENAENAERAGPQKPAAHAAIRAALIQAADQPMSEAQRAVLRDVDAFYASNGDAPIFFTEAGWTDQARGAFDRLQKAPDDGLDLRAWRVYSLDMAPTPALAAGEVALAQAVAAYAFQASGGRIEPARVNKLIGLRPDVVSAERALTEVSKAADADAQLAAYNPQTPGYQALRGRLGAMRDATASIRFAAQEASRDAKRRASDARSPVAGALARGRQEADLLANMEMWRWMPRELGSDRIMVNVPEYAARLYRGGALAATNRIIVGKPNTPTPLFSDRMEYVVVNPSWYVPQSIVKKEMMGRSLEGYDVVWQNGMMHVRQPPGERNALGRLKFIFPNAYAVYMHDTPSRSLFATTRRAYSHGCMRVDQPLAWAVAVLGPQSGWSEKRIEKMYGKSERRVDLPEPLPIYIGYFTERVDENGQLQAFEDVYGYAAEVKKRLGLGG